MRTRTSVVVLLLAAAACGDRRTTTAPSASSRTFALTGTVTGGNVFGVAAPVQAPIAGATLTILDGPNAAQATTTDVSGRYRFAGLQPSAFTVGVSASGYVSRTEAVALASNQTLDFDLTQPPATIDLTGRVTDADTTAPIGGAVVSINGRYQGATDGAGRYSVTGLLDAGGQANYTYVSANGYASDYRRIQGDTHDVRLHRIERVNAGESTVVTIAPDDTLCVNNSQDEPGYAAYVCRSVRVAATRDGVMTCRVEPAKPHSAVFGDGWNRGRGQRGNAGECPGPPVIRGEDLDDVAVTDEGVETPPDVALPGGHGREVGPHRRLAVGLGDLGVAAREQDGRRAISTASLCRRC